jgi:tRNA (Thr-GGU) A37 N-methylase
MSPVRLLKVESNLLTVADVDILDGTPLLDIKPYVPHFDCFEVTRCGWVEKAARRRHVADSRFETGGRES